MEDEKLIRKHLVYGFDYESLDCVVVGEGRDGQEGIELIEKLNPDIVITDINMPVYDAFDMFEETIDYLYSTIIISGYNEFENAQKAIKYGVSEFIVKPIEENELKHALIRAIQQLRINKKAQQYINEQNQLAALSILEPINDSLKDEVVHQMIEYIKENFDEKFVFADVAKHIGYSQSHLYNRFKQGTQMTFNEYLTKYRIQQSLNMLKSNKYELYQIAYECGFSEYKYYNKVFKKHMGISAAEYREIILYN